MTYLFFEAPIFLASCEDFTKASALREAAGPIMEWAQEIFGNVKRKVWPNSSEKTVGFGWGGGVLSVILLETSIFSGNLMVGR